LLLWLGWYLFVDLVHEHEAIFAAELGSDEVDVVIDHVAVADAHDGLFGLVAIFDEMHSVEVASF